jgi:hypothetical protein
MAKKQHYVPQFILRNWSEDGSSIKVLLLQDNKIIEKAPINGQAQKNFYYGEDQKIEKLYASLEGDACFVIQKIRNREELSREDVRVLRHFIAVQNTRTPGKIQGFDDIITEMSKDLLIKSHKFDDCKKEIDNVQINVNKHQYWQLLMYLQSFLLYADLQFAILESKDTNKFIIGQDPVIITNKFLSEKKWINSKKGLGIKGVTILLPISPEYMICFYDKEAYLFIGNRLYHKLDDDEINNLNKFQFLNTENSIYFRYYNQEYINYNSQTTDYRTNTQGLVKSFPITNGNQIVQTGSKDFPLEPIQNFFAIKEKAWKLPLEYCALEREGARLAQEYIKRDPKLSKVLQLH